MLIDVTAELLPRIRAGQHTPGRETTAPQEEDPDAAYDAAYGDYIDRLVDDDQLERIFGEIF